VLYRYSYMLMSEPLQALRETRRVLRAGGRVAFSTWGEPQRNPWMTLSDGLMIERGLMVPFSTEGPGMFAMPDAETITPLVTEAGFGEVEVEEMELSWRFDGSDELWIFASELQGPIAPRSRTSRTRSGAQCGWRSRSAPPSSQRTAATNSPDCPSTWSPTESRAFATCAVRASGLGTRPLLVWTTGRRLTRRRRRFREVAHCESGLGLARQGSRVSSGPPVSPTFASRSVEAEIAETRGRSVEVNRHVASSEKFEAE
jgi:hypothetical protein